MTLAGTRYWGHQENFPEAYSDLMSMLENHSTAESVVYLLEDDEEPVGFYEVLDRGEYVELLRMFLRPDRIGTGLGSLMWEHCVAEASHFGNRLLIMSDPAALGFYEAMGATLEKEIEVSPGFRLGVFWFDLPLN